LPFDWHARPKEEDDEEEDEEEEEEEEEIEEHDDKDEKSDDDDVTRRLRRERPESVRPDSPRRKGVTIIQREKERERKR